MNFYPNIKEYVSPSALSSWFTSKSGFIKSYFMGIKTPETLAMKAGTRIHKLIEIGAITPLRKFDRDENELSHEFGFVKLFGKPDSFTLDTDGICPSEFVDYKTGQNETWDAHTLKSDIKMLATAYLVWVHNSRPKEVTGHIEWIETVYDKEQKDIVPTGRPHELYTVVYEVHDFNKFESLLQKTVAEINAEYEKFLSSEEVPIDPDLIEEFQSLEAQSIVIEARKEEIKNGIAEQMKIANKRSLPLEIGTFSISEKKKYEYPNSLRVNYGTYGLVLEDVEEINKALKAVKKIWERENEPVEVTTSVSFRAKK